MKNMRILLRSSIFVWLAIGCMYSGWAQNFKVSPGDTLTSVQVTADRMLTLMVYAPLAKEVKIGGTDIPEKMRNTPMVKQADGVWKMTIGPIEPGAYRYSFMIDNVSVLDPRNPAVSESNINSWSLLYVGGADFMELKQVPHGAVAEVNYYSTVLQKNRRMHVYTPAGYEKTADKLPVFYLLHGAFDSDDSWSTVGRASIIMDNLIAEKKAEPMIIVMPAGHTAPFTFAMFAKLGRDEFIQEFHKDIKPYIENNYRVLTDRSKQAIAGLSMGGAHTLNIAIPNLEQFSSFAVFSSGVFGITGTGFGGQKGPSWEEQNMTFLANEALKKDLKLVWFATGKEDFLVETSRATVALLTKHNFPVIYKETSGAHTWDKWREYLHEYAQLLFK